MDIYSADRALEYDQIIKQPIYKFYVNKKLQFISGWIDPESLVLDVGCGTGAYTTSLAKGCKDIVGFDISAKMVEIASSKAKALGLRNVNFLVADLEYFPFQEKIFDLVFSINLFHHINDKRIIEKGFHEQFRCCRRGKHILVFELNPHSLGWSKELIPRVIRGFIYILLFPSRQKIIDNIEIGTKMLSIVELVDELKETKLILKKVSGFIPTYCPLILFNIFMALERLIESTPLLKNYGAHVLLVGEVR